MSCDFIFVHDAKFLIKHIFTFHIIKNNYFFIPPIAFTSITIRFLLHLHWDWDGSLRTVMVRRRRSEPTDFRPASWSGHPTGSRCYPIPIARCQHHQLHQMPDPLVSISNSLPIAFPIREFLPPYSRLWRSLTGIINRNTSNYTRNTYI